MWIQKLQCWLHDANRYENSGEHAHCYRNQMAEQPLMRQTRSFTQPLRIWRQEERKARITLFMLPCLSFKSQEVIAKGDQGGGQGGAVGVLPPPCTYGAGAAQGAAGHGDATGTHTWSPPRNAPQYLHCASQAASWVGGALHGWVFSWSFSFSFHSTTLCCSMYWTLFQVKKKKKGREGIITNQRGRHVGKCSIKQQRGTRCNCWPSTHN